MVRSSLLLNVHYELTSGIFFFTAITQRLQLRHFLNVSFHNNHSNRKRRWLTMHLPFKLLSGSNDVHFHPHIIGKERQMAMPNATTRSRHATLFCTQKVETLLSGTLPNYPLFSTSASQRDISELPITSMAIIK